MKFNLMNIRIVVPILTCITILMLTTTTATYSQKNTQQVLSAHSNVFKSFLTKDSTLFFSQLSSDLLFIRSNGQTLNRSQLWKMATGMHGGMKAIFEITSINVKGSVAWMTYQYTMTSSGNSYNEIVNYVDDLENYSWIETAIFLKKGKKWQMVLAQYSDAPEKK